MVVTFVEAEVQPEHTHALLEAWHGATRAALPAGFAESFLLRYGDVWRIATVWESREALEEMRRRTDVPAAFLIFRAAGIEPTLTVFDAAGHVTA